MRTSMLASRLGLDSTLLIFATHNWSPLRSPKAATLPSGVRPREPAPIRELLVNRLGGKGQIAFTDNQFTKNARVQNARMDVQEA